MNYTAGKDWSGARETCLNVNSDLVSIKSEEENKFVVATFFIEDLAWIGLQLDVTAWSDGSNATYFAPTLQTAGPTKRDCYALNSTLQWFVVHCSTGLKQAVCKRMGLYKVLRNRAILLLDLFMPPLHFITIPLSLFILRC